MKKTVLQTAILALIVPFSSAYSLGLGQMAVKSALDQPFLAEIELIDVQSVALKDVRVSVADPENFEEIGLERAAVLSFLNFKIDKNEQGKEVITVQSTERMSEPYMELVVDLTWPEGQLYKAYTILLDPPGYRLVTTIIQGGAPHYKHSKKYNEPGVIDKTVFTTVNHHPSVTNDAKKKSTYGPTVTNENIWQIAQRYKTSEVILPQVVLAIVGTNPDAFSEENLNGLKSGMRLTIPGTQEILKVPADLATAEVMAHDKAWNDKSPINHVLTPPYINQPVEKNSDPATSANPVPTTEQTLPSTLPQWIPPNSTNPSNTQLTVSSQNPELDTTVKTELSITAAAIESVREVNALLMEQLHELKKKNEELQKQLDERNKELSQVRSQIQVLIKERQSVASEAHTANAHDDNNNEWLLILLLMVIGGGAGFAYWYLQKQRANNKPNMSSDWPSDATSSPVVEVKPNEKPNDNETNEDRSSSTELVLAPIEENKPHPQPVGSELSEQTKQMMSNDNDNLSDDSISEPSVSTFNTPAPVKPDETAISFEKEVITETEHIPEEKKDGEETNKETFLEFTPEPIEEIEEQSIDVDENLSPSVDPKEVKEDAPQELLEFESGLHTLLSSDPKEPSKQETEENNNGIDFIFTEEQDEPKSRPDKKEEQPIEVDDSLSQFFAENKDESKEESTLEDSIKPDNLKSKKALDTLLALAKTYISMDDFESARHSLEEVIEHGTKKQKEEAVTLLDSIKGNK